PGIALWISPPDTATNRRSTATLTSAYRAREIPAGDLHWSRRGVSRQLFERAAGLLDEVLERLRRGLHERRAPARLDPGDPLELHRRLGVGDGDGDDVDHAGAADRQVALGGERHRGQGAGRDQHLGAGVEEGLRL